MLAWLLGLVHTLGQGSDARSVWFLVPLALLTTPAFVLLFARFSPGPPPAREMRRVREMRRA